MATHSRANKKQLQDILKESQNNIDRLINLESLAHKEMIVVKSELIKQKTSIKEITLLRQNLKKLTRINNELSNTATSLLSNYNKLLTKHLNFIRGYERMRLILKKEIENNKR